MRSNTLDMMNKVKTFLIENTHISAKAIAKKCKMSEGAVYRLIRLMRNDGIGIHVTSKGYVLSEFASKIDDTGFLRRLNGRRTSDCIAIQASAPYIKKRWNTVEDKRGLGIILGALSSDLTLLGEGLSVIQALEDKQGLAVI